MCIGIQCNATRLKLFPSIIITVGHVGKDRGMRQCRGDP